VHNASGEREMEAKMEGYGEEFTFLGAGTQSLQPIPDSRIQTKIQQNEMFGK
jgi:hypothetical protein